MNFLSAIPRLAWQALGLILVALSFMWWVSCHDKRILEAAKANERIATRDTVIAVMEGEAARRDTVYIQGRTIYRDVAANPASTKADVVRACNVIVAACDSVRSANTRLRDTLAVQVAELKKMKAIKPPRFSAFAEGLYDVVNTEWVARGGIDFRIVGPISLTVAGEAQPKDSKARGLVGLRYTFK